VGGNSRVFAFLRGKAPMLLSAALLVQAAAYYSIPKAERQVVTRPLADFPSQIGQWRMLQELTLDEAVQRKLRADDVLNRVYASDSQPASAGLYVAFFKSQRAGVAPHSPKNCLPGSGFVPLVSGTVSIPVPGRAEPLTVNRYVVARGEEKTLVLYWYQTPNRVIASEYEAKFWLVADALRYRRSDTALVRVVVPVGPLPAEAAEAEAVDFVKAVYPALKAYLPN
jgi:EpsI family protein